MLAGDARHAEDLAERVLAICAERAADTELSDYYTASDGATAALILGDLDATEKYLRQCATTHRGNFMLVANTRRQLRRICQSKTLDDRILDVASLPAVIHYTGHMITVSDKGGRFPAAQETRVQAEITAHLDQFPVGFAFGGLACGADLMIVEALLERGAHVHVILPFDIEAYKAYSVARAGRAWMERFDACLPRVTQLTFVTQDRLRGDTLLFAHASRLAMGMAKLRAETLDAPLEQLAVWDREPPREAAGTAANIAFWENELALRTHVIDSGGQRLPPAPSGRRQNGGVRQRTVRAMLFGDVKGFSSLSDSQMPSFVEAIMEPVGATLRDYGEIVDFCNTWGDGLFVVFKDIEGAAHCALAIQERLAGVVMTEFGLPADLRMRLGLHAGPVIALQDPVTDGPNFFGAHVSRTARIEPVTPEGEVYVTEDFAALLALAKSPELVMEYVGKINAAKNYGTLRMYSLRRQPTGVAVAAESARPVEGNRQPP